MKHSFHPVSEKSSIFQNVSSLPIFLTKMAPEPRGVSFCVLWWQDGRNGMMAQVLTSTSLPCPWEHWADRWSSPWTPEPAVVGTWSHLILLETVRTPTYRVCCPWGLLWLPSLASWSPIFSAPFVPWALLCSLWRGQIFPAGFSDPTGMCSILHQSDFLHGSCPPSPPPFHWNYSFQVHWWPPYCPT